MRLIRNALAVGFMVGATSLMAAPAIVPLKSSIDFGKKVPGEPGANWMEAAYSNLGDQSLTFTGAGISIQGQDAGDFRFREVPTTAPMSYGSRYVNLEFAPGSVGSKEATLVFTTNDPDDPTTSILLTGEAVPFRGTLANGPYDGYGPGQSTVGTGGDYASLQDAVTAINAHPLTGGDWSFLILNDLDEPGSLLIGQPNTSSNTITLRPAPNTNPTVTFTSTTNRVNNVTVSGHIIIGSKIERRLQNSPRLLPVRMQSFVIDGCNTVGGSERNLTLTNVDGPGSLVMVHAMGDADRVAIRNCKFDCYAVAAGVGYSYRNVVKFLGVEEIVANQLGTNLSWGSPDYGEVANCDFRTTRSQEVIISYNSLDGLALTRVSNFVPASGFKIVGNSITVRDGSGVTVDFASDGQVTSNSIVLTEPGVAENAWVWGISVLATNRINGTGAIDISSNSVRFENAGLTCNPIGIGAHARHRGTVTRVINNSISGVTAPSGLTGSRNSAGIHLNFPVGSTTTLAHNSVALRHVPGLPEPAPNQCAVLYIITPQTGRGHVTLLNNILSTNIPQSCFVYCLTSLDDRFDSDWNNFARVNGTSVGYINSNTYLGLEDWQSAFGTDVHSISQDPFVAALPGAGVWVGPGDSGSPDLHFTAHPGAIYKVPQLDGIETDIDGNVRPENYTLMGAHQPPGPPAMVAAWEIY